MAAGELVLGLTFYRLMRNMIGPGWRLLLPLGLLMFSPLTLEVSSLWLVGLLVLASARTFPWLIGGASLMGIGSTVFHPESSRVARLASGGRHGLAQSVFQVGGNLGTSLGPLIAAFLVVPRGQASIAYCSLLAMIGMVLLFRVGRWSAEHLMSAPTRVDGGLMWPAGC